ncbi:TetR/AcrR family transcriptional regulator [Pelagibius sp.]|uniref:TetR/AcrR family transcriptional regulator n=1 Tax=Pelagibius sp. TaxID=1931238 RepID=UPI002601D98B|nr:TetR/AcrR family transcriptional regulator [Pelagibius sp.]
MSKSEETRDRIARAALTLFVEQGVAATRTREIATAAGVAEGSIYRYFDSKEALARQLFKQVYVRYAEDLQAIAAKGTGFRTTWKAMVAHLCYAFDEDADAFRFLLITQHEHLGEISAELESPVEVVRAVMARAIENGEVSLRDPNLATALGLGAVVQAAIFVLYGQLKGPLSAWTEDIQTRSLKALR